MQFSVNVVIHQRWLSGLLDVFIVSGKSSSVRMRAKNVRKPVVGESEVTVPIWSMSQLCNAYFHYGAEPVDVF